MAELPELDIGAGDHVKSPKRLVSIGSERPSSVAVSPMQKVNVSIFELLARFSGFQHGRCGEKSRCHQ